VRQHNLTPRLQGLGTVSREYLDRFWLSNRKSSSELVSHRRLGEIVVFLIQKVQKNSERERDYIRSRPLGLVIWRIVM
jgi:hypothetical protein